MRNALRTALVIAPFALMMFAFTLNASADKPSYGCAPGFDIGPRTADQALELPNVVAGLEAGIYDEAFVREVQDIVDKNGNGLICFKTYPSNSAPSSLHQYFYNVVDDKASVRSG